MDEEMSERKLAHIELIESLSPIEGADKIEVAQVLGWQCVVKKGEFKIGDKVVYVEVDSVMPEKPEYEFLRDRKFRIRTIKLKGQVSQGLLLPITSISKEHPTVMLEIGRDVTNLLGITKYLSPSERTEIEQLENSIKLEKSKLKKFLLRYSFFRGLFLSKRGKYGFPYWVDKTDEERIQNIPGVLQKFADELVYVTEKVDYQSVTFTGKMVPNTIPVIGKILPKKFKFIVCSRNFINNDKASLYWRIAQKHNIENILKQNPTLTIQGEQGSTNVQGNKYCISEPKIWIFNIFDHEKNYHYSYMQMLDFCMKNDLTTVPYIGMFKLSDIATDVESMINYSKGKSIINPKINREGVVVRCIRDGKKLLSFKAINPDFLIQYE